MVVVAQLVRASDCGSECRGFESRLPPLSKTLGSLVKTRVFSLFGANNPLAFAAKDQGPLLVEANSCSGKSLFTTRLESAILTNLAGLGFPLKNTRNL